MSSSDDTFLPGSTRRRSKRPYHSSSEDTESRIARKAAHRAIHARLSTSTWSSSSREGSPARNEDNVSNKAGESEGEKGEDKNRSRSARSKRVEHKRSSSFGIDHPFVHHARTSSYAVYQQSVSQFNSLIFY